MAKIDRNSKYPLNLIEDLFGKEIHKFGLCPDYEACVEYILHCDNITPLQREVIKFAYSIQMDHVYQVLYYFLYTKQILFEEYKRNKEEALQKFRTERNKFILINGIGYLVESALSKKNKDITRFVVVKRNGNVEPYDSSKIRKAVEKFFEFNHCNDYENLARSIEHTVDKIIHDKFNESCKYFAPVPFFSIDSKSIRELVGEALNNGCLPTAAEYWMEQL